MSNYTTHVKYKMLILVHGTHQRLCIIIFIIIINVSDRILTTKLLESMLPIKLRAVLAFQGYIFSIFSIEKKIFFYIFLYFLFTHFC